MNLMTKTDFKDLANFSRNASGSIVSAGETARKNRLLDEIVPRRGAENHRAALSHIHDLEFYDETYNCIGLNVADLIGRPRCSFPKALRRLFREITALTNRQSGGIGFLNFDADMAEFVLDVSDDEIRESLRDFFSDLNCATRKGCEKPYITFNFGLDVSPAGRRVSRGLLAAYLAGDDDGRPFVFPNLVFKLKREINFSENAPNADLLSAAFDVTSRRMIPTYFNCDSSANRSAPAEKIGVMGCRTRVVDNLFGEKSGLRRGNVACASVNLVQAALLSEGDPATFFRILGRVVDETRDVLLHRFETLCRKKDFSEISGKQLYLGSESGGDTREILKNGTLAIGFIGLWDALSVLFGKEWTDLEAMRPYRESALRIVSFLRERTDSMTRENGLNFSLLATAAEGLCGKCAEHDGKRFDHPVCRKGYYVNSFHVPVETRCDVFEKIEFEGAFHALCNGGSISYVELSESPEGNAVAVEDLVREAVKRDCNYFGVNFPLDVCKKCGHVGRTAERCPRCGAASILRLRRVSGYLAETDRFTKGKSAELAARISHGAFRKTETTADKRLGKARDSAERKSC